MGIIGFIIYLMFYASAIFSYNGELKLLYLCYLFGVMFLSGIGGETICVTGHRFLQVICLAYFISDQSV